MELHIKSLILRSTEEDKTEIPETEVRTSNTARYVTIRSPNAGFYVRQKFGESPKEMYYSILVKPPVIWKENALKILQTLPNEYEFERIKVDAHHLEAIKLICIELLKFKKTNIVTLYISDQSYQLIKKEDPGFYDKIKTFFHLEQEFDSVIKEDKRKKEFNTKSLSERVKRVALSENLTSMQRRLYLYLYGRFLQATITENYKLIIFDHIFTEELTQELNLNKKMTVKALDELKKKGLINVELVRPGLKYFLLTKSGPVDIVKSARPSR